MQESAPEDRDHWSKWGPEAASPVRLAAAQHQYADRNQNKGKECTDVGELREQPYVKKPGWDRHQQACHPSSHSGCTKLRMHFAEAVRQQPVAGHCKPYARLAS